MRYLNGTKQEFFDFLNSISSEDSVAVLTHTDLDGIASGIFIEEILKARGSKCIKIDFVEYGNGAFDKGIQNLLDGGANKIFITDLKFDDSEFFERYQDGKEKDVDVFVIDHHPLEKKFAGKNLRNIIKTESSDCAALVVFEFASEIKNMDKFEWLLCASLISDISYKKAENMEIIKKKYPGVREKFIFDSIPGRLAKKIASAIVYFKEDLKEAYELIKEKDLKEIDEIHEIIEEDIKDALQQFEESAEYFPDKKLCFAKINPKFKVTSIVASKISFREENLDKIFILFSSLGEDKYKISARNQSGIMDLNLLMKNSVKGLEDAIGGGHAKASGASILKKDLEKFKANVLANIK